MANKYIRKFKFKKDFHSLTRPVKYFKNQVVVIETVKDFNSFMNDFKDRAGLFVINCIEVKCDQLMSNKGKLYSIKYLDDKGITGIANVASFSKQMAISKYCETFPGHAIESISELCEWEWEADKGEENVN